jgi:hypothetical protein
MWCNALDLPFAEGSFSVVTAFLFDPYNNRRLYEAIYKVLGGAGQFIGTLPHFQWGSTLRKRIQYPQHKTRFVTKDASSIELDSYLMPEKKIKRLLPEAGFVSVELFSLCLPTTASKVSGAHLRSHRS